ncbi:hypothetical protein P7C73_g3322, partial [Tremellales sp. Uapishka_1]
METQSTPKSKLKLTRTPSAWQSVARTVPLPTSPRQELENILDQSVGFVMANTASSQHKQKLKQGNQILLVQVDPAQNLLSGLQSLLRAPLVPPSAHDRALCAHPSLHPRLSTLDDPLASLVDRHALVLGAPGTPRESGRAPQRLVRFPPLGLVDEMDADARGARGRAFGARMGEEPCGDGRCAGRQPSLDRLGRRGSGSSGGLLASNERKPALTNETDTLEPALYDDAVRVVVDGSQFGPLNWLRYGFPPTSLVSPLTPSRYTTFIPLYPLGAGSEAFLSFSTLPPLSSLPHLPTSLATLSPLSVLPPSIRNTVLRSKVGRGLLWKYAQAKVAKNKVVAEWGALELARLALFIIWWPALYVLYTYMIKQRKKVLGKGRTVGKAKTM